MRKGFTLVELIFSLSLMLILAGGMFFALGQGLRGWRKAAQKASNLQIKNLVAERITADIRFAEEILAGSGSQEIILKIGSDQISYKLVERKVRRKKGTASAYLTCEDKVRNLSFSYPSANMIRVGLDELVWQIYVRN